MFAQLTKKNLNLKCVVPAAILMTVAGVFIGLMVFAQAASGPGRDLGTIDPAFFQTISNRTRIDPVAMVTANGRHLILTGPIACTGGERAYVRLTVTQRSTGAVAEGNAFLTCTGNTQQWEVHASTQSKESFAEGPATAVALARSTVRGDATDAHQWLVDITLVR